MRPERNEKVIQEWRRRKIRQALILVPCFLALLIITQVSLTLQPFFWSLPTPQLATVAIVVIVVCFVLSALNGRCPACGQLPGYGLNIRFCSQCGIPLK